MRNQSKLKPILTLCFALFSSAILAHDIPVHQAITFNAQESAYDDSSAYSNFLGIVSSDIAFVDATNSMVKGSAFEDFIDKPGDVGGERSLNHFYDPIRKIGLTDPVLEGTNSFAWASVSNCVGVNFYGFLGFGANLNTSNIWSWQNARGYEWLGLTATNHSDRQAALTNMFRAVGQVMHLLEDTSQPQHVRNEEHLDKLFHMDLQSRSAIEDYGLAHSNSLNYAHSMLDWRGDGFTQLKDFWDRDFLRTSGRTALNNDTNGGTSTLGLAEFTSGNFIGQRAVYAEFVPTNDIHYFAFPSLADTTQPNLQLGNLWGTATHGDVTLQNFHQGTRLYISKTNAGVQVTYHSALSYLTAMHPDKSPGLPILTIADDNVLSNYHNIFIPKAVQYSAGLLDYYFRGTIATSLTQDTNSQYIFGVTNTSGQTFGGGAFYLVNEDSSGVRTIVQTNQLIGTLPSGSSTNIAYPGDVTNKMLVIYRGNIGTASGTTNALDPVDAGIGLAAAYAATCDCGTSPTSIGGLVWTFSGSAYMATVTASGSGNSGTISIPDTQAAWGTLSASFCNPTSKAITIQTSATLSWVYNSFWDGSYANEDRWWCVCDFANTSIGVDSDDEPTSSGSGSVSGIGTTTVPAYSVASLGPYFETGRLTAFGSTVTYSITLTVSVVP